MAKWQDAAAVALQARLAVSLEGEPATAKTSWLQGFARSQNWYMETVIASVREPADFGGFLVPTADGKGAVRIPDAWVNRLIDAVAHGLTPFVFLDEANTAPPATQAALLRFIFERVIGDHRLPADMAVALAVNPPECSAGAYEWPAPMANRLIHLQVDPQEGANEWADGIEGDWPSPIFPILPARWREQLPTATALVANFIRHRPEQLHAMPKEEAGRAGAWPSRRTWDFARTVLAATEALILANPSQRAHFKAVQAFLVSGCVGKGSAIAFADWRQTLRFPSVEEALSKPDKVKIPDDDSITRVFLSAVIHAARADGTASTFKPAATLINRVMSERGIDVGTPAFKALTAADKDASGRPGTPRLPKGVAIADLAALTHIADLNRMIYGK